MDAALKQKWCAALRSGEYKQAIGALARPGQGYCCLGVLLTEIDGKITYENDPYNRCGALTGCDIAPFIRMNDREQLPFSAIADYIEKHL